MEELELILKEALEEERLIGLVLSNNKNKENKIKKIDIKPIELREELYYQFSIYIKDQVKHENIRENILEEILAYLRLGFRQAMIFTTSKDYQVLVSKKSKIKIIEKAPTRTMPELSHNRSKIYLIEEGRPCDFLIRLGIMNKNGLVHKSKYDKFKQINRFLELVEDSLDSLDKTSTINIVDFGCGKSYLTFALYYYLVKLKSYDVNIIGLDLKEDVIELCNQIKDDLGYEGLKFIQGDIADYEGSEDVHMVVTLHACDTATDAALVKAIGWNTRLILSVPCCQKEIRRQIDSDQLQPMLKHGIVKEKLSSLVTDSLRAMVLELLGYKVQLLEFIDLENTPKNTLIRAINTGSGFKEKEVTGYYDFKNFWNLKKLFIEDELEKIGIKL